MEKVRQIGPDDVPEIIVPKKFAVAVLYDAATNKPAALDFIAMLGDEHDGASVIIRFGKQADAEHFVKGIVSRAKFLWPDFHVDQSADAMNEPDDELL
jgi:hypothetical protein